MREARGRGGERRREGWGWAGIDGGPLNAFNGSSPVSGGRRGVQTFVEHVTAPPPPLSVLDECCRMEVRRSLRGFQVFFVNSSIAKYGGYIGLCVCVERLYG